MGYRVKEMREKRNLTQEQLAKKSGVSRLTIAMLETHEEYVTTTKTLIKLATALNTSIDNIFFANCVQSAEHHNC